MVSIAWTALSKNDLQEIYDYISEDSERYASITVNKIYNRAQDIIYNIHIGRIVPELNVKSIREIIIGNYRLVYRVKSKDKVDILRVYHSARLMSIETL